MQGFPAELLKNAGIMEGFTMAFDNFNRVTAKKLYTYRRNPLHSHSFVILKQLEQSGQYEPVGDYTVLDQDEEPVLSEKKVMNLVALMNDSDEVMDLRRETKTRLLYYRAPSDDPSKVRIIFYALGSQGVSTENAVLSLEEEMEDAGA